MCGRFTVNLTFEELENYVKENYAIEDMKSFSLPRYNVAPGTEVISLLHDGSKYRIGELRWGFIPSFVKNDESFSLINIKSETIFEKEMFKKVALQQRCVILADSFYEWNQNQKNDFPRRIMLKEKKIFKMASIWNTYIKSDGTKIHTVGILTTEANDLIKEIHHRMPVILTDETEKTWLNPREKNEKILYDILKPYESQKMMMHRVTKKINSPRYQEEDAIKDIGVIYEE